MPAPQRIAWVPEGMAAKSANPNVRLALVARLYHQAAMHMRFSASLAQEQTKSGEDRSRLIARQQKQFAWHVQQGHTWLSLLEDGGLADWQRRWTDLADANRKLAQEHGYDAHRLSAEKFKGPLHSQNAESVAPDAALPMLLAGSATHVPLQFAATERHAEMRTRSELVVLVALALLVLSFFPHSLGILHAAVPEVALAATLAASWFFGLGVIALAVLAGIAALRCVTTTRFLMRLVYSWRHPPTKQPSATRSAQA